MGILPLDPPIQKTHLDTPVDKLILGEDSILVAIQPDHQIVIDCWFLIYVDILTFI